jgi:tyrosinase
MRSAVRRLRNRRRAFRPRFENLETRCLLSSGVFVGPIAPVNPTAPTFPVSSLSHLDHNHGAAQGGPTTDIPIPNPGPRDPNAATVRQNADTLTDNQITDFVDTVKALKTKYENGSVIDVYDEFVLIHQEAMEYFRIHNGPAFFPWHRWLLDLFERELQTINPNVTIPYWDWTVDNRPDAFPWTDNFMGGNGDPNDSNIVKTGPFREGQWTLITNDGPYLTRQLGYNVSSLPTADQEQTALQIDSYDVDPYGPTSDPSQSFRNFMVGWNSPSGEPEMHNRLHTWVGGAMITEASPNDPIFWLIHANLDRIWAEWQATHTDNYPETGAPDGENLYDHMPIAGFTPADMLDHFALGYSYDTETPPPGGGGASAGGAGLALRTFVTSVSSGHAGHTLAISAGQSTKTDGGTLLASGHVHGVVPAGALSLAQAESGLHFHGAGLLDGLDASLSGGMIGIIGHGNGLNMINAPDSMDHGQMGVVQADVAGAHVAMANMGSMMVMADHSMPVCH